MESESENPKIEPLTELATEFLCLAETAYDKGYDDGFKARDEMAGRHQKQAEELAYNQGWIDGANAAISRRSYNPIDGH